MPRWFAVPLARKENTVAAESGQQLDVAQLVREAHQRTRNDLIPTPLQFSRYLSNEIKGEVWLRVADLAQRTASFKFRGAINKILSLTEEELDREVVTASTGNYALAVAEAMRLRGRVATFYVAKNLDESRLKLLKFHGLAFGHLWRQCLGSREGGPPSR